MPATMAPLAVAPRWLSSRDGFSRHHFAGANTVMLTMLKHNAETFDVNASDLDAGIARARSMLQSAVVLAITNATLIDGNLDLQLTLTNRSGHKAPTSFPSRRMRVHLRIEDEKDNVLFESGALNADGSIFGNDGDTNTDRFEPHYDLITREDQVQIYEAIMGNSDGDVTYTLLRAARYLKDNRLTPQGFEKATAPNDVAVLGAAVDDANFNLGQDQIRYRLPIVASGKLTIWASLEYQPLAYGFAADLSRDREIDEVGIFLDLYQGQALKHETMIEVTTQLQDTDGDGTADPIDTDDDGDGMPDDYEISNGLDPLDPADADRDDDEDGFSNYAEFVARTDPQDPRSNRATRGSVISLLQLLLED